MASSSKANLTEEDEEEEEEVCFLHGSSFAFFLISILDSKFPLDRK